MAKILETNNYGKFVLSPCNREVKKTWNLEASLLKYGFRDGTPIEVVRLENGLLEIQDGHNRFYAARKLGIAVKYVEVKDRMTAAERGTTTTMWSMRDYLISFSKGGNTAYAAVLAYHKKTGIGLNACISMMAGDSAGSGNWRKQFKNGTYRLGDLGHANLVGSLVLHCKKCGFLFGDKTPFVQAISKIAWAEGFDPQLLKSKITTFPEHMKKQGSKQDYITMLEAIYNRHSQVKMPLAFKAEEASRRRNVVMNREGRPVCRTERRIEAGQ